MIVDGEGGCVGTRYGLRWVWLERCRDGRYAVNALRCDVWVVCARLPVCTVACFFVFWGIVFFVGVHPYMSAFCTFCKVLFSVLFRGVFFGRWHERVKSVM